MKRALILIVLVPLAGCATLKKVAHFRQVSVQRSAAERKLAAARGMLDRGEPARAARQLAAVCEGGAVPGVTDEALFRLAVLDLRQGNEKQSPFRAEQLLRRLKREYPASPWTVQAAPLAEILAAMDELRKQDRDCHTLNQSLSRKVNELNQQIEKLKQLDLEIEEKSR